MSETKLWYSIRVVGTIMSRQSSADEPIKSGSAIIAQHIEKIDMGSPEERPLLLCL